MIMIDIITFNNSEIVSQVISQKLCDSSQSFIAL